MVYTLGLYLIVEQPSYGKTVLPYRYPEKRMLPAANHNSQCLITALDEINTNCITFDTIWKKKKNKQTNLGILNAT